ncbi:galactoside-binding lectin family protein [Aphelenchoides avenae]|nr:galactoside-binding lectin family protein [Aphelenchus avenae]
MASILRKIFGFHRKKVTQKDAITGRNNSFPVPYLSKLEGNQLQPGQSLIIRGIVVGRTEFVVNLTSGPRVEFDEATNTLDNRLLCVKVDITAKKVHLNACIDGEWGREGTVKHKWQQGDEFDIRIRCHEEEFEIFIEHKLVARFAHYVPLTNISHIYINGDVELYSVSWEGKYYVSVSLRPKTNLLLQAIPYAADIPGNFYPGRKLYVSALAKNRAKQFTIDFHSGEEIACRVNPRFPAKVWENYIKIICNSQIGGNWGQEERLQAEVFPFRRKRSFDLLIYCEESKFVIYVDDVLIGTFEHRINPRNLDRLTVDGDIVLQGVHLKY